MVRHNPVSCLYAQVFWKSLATHSLGRTWCTGKPAIKSVRVKIVESSSGSQNQALHLTILINGYGIQIVQSYAYLSEVRENSMRVGLHTKKPHMFKKIQKLKQY